MTPRPYSIDQRPSFGEWLRLAAPDLLSLLVLGALAIAIATRPPARTHLFPVIPGHVPDLQYAYPYRGRIIPSWAAGLIAVGVPAAVILLLQIRIRSFWDAHGALLGLATALLCASLFQATLKWICGGLRPHFYDRCRPDPSALAPQQAGTGYGDVMYTTAACTQRAGLEGDAVASFPSGHAAALWAAMGFLALYLNAKLEVLGGARQAPAWKLAALLAPPLAACLVCASLLADHSHHARDLVAGALLGAACALAAYRMRYARLWDQRYNHVPLNLLAAYRYDETWDRMALSSAG
ncbi:hypothetical protein DL765_006112 [Monosporascus sp. GIB2]|nr:hypothetical protein DL765_006112 [Monosporascus sp. GIB2]